MKKIYSTNFNLEIVFRKTRSYMLKLDSFLKSFSIDGAIHWRIHSCKLKSFPLIETFRSASWPFSRSCIMCVWSSLPGSFKNSFSSLFLSSFMHVNNSTLHLITRASRNVDLFRKSEIKSRNHIVHQTNIIKVRTF